MMHSASVDGRDGGTCIPESPTGGAFVSIRGFVTAQGDDGSCDGIWRWNFSHVLEVAKTTFNFETLGQFHRINVLKPILKIIIYKKDAVFG